MHKQQLLSDRCTILIDNTIDLENSDQLKEFFNNVIIKDLILDGKLNVVLLKSAQKFDMLGMDNYYGEFSLL